MERKKTVRESVSGEGRKCGWRKAMFNSQQKRQALRTILGAVLTAANGALFALMWFHFYKMKMYIFNMQNQETKIIPMTLKLLKITCIK